jgi:hypothetical protein
LLSNNPDKAAQLTRLGVTVTAHVQTRVHLSAANAGYLATKAGRGAHTLQIAHSDRRTRSADGDEESSDQSQPGTPRRHSA